MIIKQETLDKIRLRINELCGVGAYSPSGHGINTDAEQHALEISVRDAFSKIAERMDLSDTEEVAVQELEKLITSPLTKDTSLLMSIVKLIRKRHEKRVVRKSAGRVLHEGFHSYLNEQGESKYGNGCWDELSDSRKRAWETAAKKLATEVVYGRVQLQDAENRPVVGVQPSARTFP